MPSSSAPQNYRGHQFVVEAVDLGSSWQGRHRIDFMRAPAQGHTLGVRWGVPLALSWATPAEALAYATEQAYAAIDAYDRMKQEPAARPDSGLRDQRLTVRYSLQQDDGVERQQEFFGLSDAMRFFHSLEGSLNHAVVLDAAGTTLVEAGIDEFHQPRRPDHADWPQTH